MAGLHLDPWEQLVLMHALSERADGRWAAFQVGVEVARQNGKGAILEARELAALFLLGERLVIHSAHEFPTSLEAFRRLLELIESTPDFDKRVKRVSKSHGEEGIELKGGQRIRFRTRTKGGGRGFTGDTVILDEAMEITNAQHAALLPTLAARPNSQIWYTGSAVDKTVHENGVVFARLRARALAGGDPRLAYLGWCGSELNLSDEELDLDDLIDDEDIWAQSNPGLGIRITLEHVEAERRALDARSFAVERLSIGDWPDPDPDEDDGGQIDMDHWKACADPESTVLDPVCFVFDVTPDRKFAAIGAAGHREDGLSHIEVVDHRPGTAWLANRLRSLKAKHKPISIRCDEKSPAASLITSLESKGVKVEPINSRQHADACGEFVDAIEELQLRHLDTPELNAAIRGAEPRPLGDSWAWSRKSSSVDISPLVAVTLALWGLGQSKQLDLSKFKKHGMKRL